MALVSAVVSCAVSRFPFCAGKGLSPRPPAPSLSHHSHGVHRLMCKDLRLFPLPFVIFVGTVSGLPHFPSNPDAMFCHHFASPISDPYIVVLCEHRAVHAAPILLLLLFLFLGPPLLSSPLAPLFYVTPSPSVRPPPFIFFFPRAPICRWAPTQLGGREEQGWAVRQGGGPYGMDMELLITCFATSLYHPI